MGRLFSIAAMLICVVYLGTHPSVVRWGVGIVTAPLNRWMENPDRQQWPAATDKTRSLERKISGKDRKEKPAGAGKAGKAKEDLGVRAVAVQKARGL